MAVTVTQRPEGNIYKLLPLDVISSAGNATFGSFEPHGIVDGDRIYIQTDVWQYNGYWYADISSATEFTVSRVLNGTKQAFIRTLSQSSGDYAVFYKVLQEHGWSCVHLPIVYELTSTLSPLSNAFATVDAFTDSSGNTSLTFTGAFSGGGLSANNTHVKIVGSSVDGIYRIVDTTVTLIIDLPYDAANVLAGSVVYIYYNNYHVRVQIYGGLTDTHYWENEKPYELISTLKLIPDNDNALKFSVSNELKKQVNTLTNNPYLQTLPNNIDAFTMFYITTQESYDYNDSGDIITHTESIVSDKSNFEGFAVNAKLPFKNINSGYLGEYLVDTNVTGAKFLTLFENPVYFEGYYFDISVLLGSPSGSLFSVKKIFYANGEQVGDEVVTQVSYTDEGLYRLQLTALCDSIEVTTTSGGTNVNNPEFANNDFELQLPSGPAVGITKWAFNGSVDHDLQWSWCSASGNACLGPYATSLVRALSAYTPGYGQEDLAYIRQSPNGTLTNTGPITYRIQAKIYVTYVEPGSTFSLEVSRSIAGPTVITTFTSNPGENELIVDADVAIGAVSFIYLELRVIGDAIDNWPATFTGPAIYIDYINVITGTITQETTTYNPDRVDLSIVDESFDEVTETKTIDLACPCTSEEIEGIGLAWLNYLGGMEYYVFTAQTEHQIDIKEAKTRILNLFPTWPDSYGSSGQTIRQETSRKSCFRKVLRSQLVSNENLEAMQYIKTSSLVQIVNGADDIRTVLVDTDSFTVYQDNDKEFSISFAIEYTDYIPSQSL
jgi:hypothetical protein